MLFLQVMDATVELFIKYFTCINLLKKNLVRNSNTYRYMYFTLIFFCFYTIDIKQLLV